MSADLLSKRQHKRTKELKRTQQQPAATETADADIVFQELQNNGINGATLSKLAKDPSVTVARIKRLASKAAKKRNPSAYLASLLLDGVDGEPVIPKNLSPKQACELVNSGELTTICGVDVGGRKAKWNTNELQVFAAEDDEQLFAKFSAAQLLGNEPSNPELRDLTLRIAKAV